MKSEKDMEGRIKSRLEPWLQEKMPDARWITISGIQKPGMGLSNETYLFDVTCNEGGNIISRGMVLRSVPAGHKVFPDYHLEHQFRIMKALRSTDVPVPEVYWLEEDEGVIGAPFYIMERLGGTMPKDYPSYHGEGFYFEATPEGRKKIWWGSLETVARTHMVDWEGLGLDFLGVPNGGVDPVLRQISYWERYLEWIKDDPAESHPELENALRWLRDNAYEPGQVCLCWGDARMGNTLYQEPDNTVVAALDWEMAFLGDPVADLAWFIFIDRYLAAEYGLQRLEGSPGPEETVARYQELTGFSVKNFAYNEVFAAMRFGMILISVVRKLMAMGMHNYEFVLRDNYCTRWLAEFLGMPSPGGPKTENMAGAKGGRVSIQFNLSGPNGVSWHIISEDGRATRHDGILENPTCRVRSTAEDWRALRAGELSQFEAWKTGRLVVDGDLKVMIELREVIDRLSAG
ncbi:MAG: phosphotransferase [Spirochaetes bacterium]|nr:phosphotransferase [Spirochaetota bacterium]